MSHLSIESSEAIQRIRVVFEYQGSTGRLVVGPRSRRHYYFRGRGDRLEVDPRDRTHMIKIPHLRQVFDQGL